MTATLYDLRVKPRELATVAGKAVSKEMLMTIEKPKKKSEEAREQAIEEVCDRHREAA